MTTLITGGTGLLGLSTAQHLLSRGEKVILFDIQPQEEGVRAIASDAEVVQGSILDAEGLGRTFKKLGVERVVHLAGVLGLQMTADAVGSTEINCVGSAQVLDVAAKAGVSKVVLVSSIAVYGGQDDHPRGGPPLTEDAPQHIREPVALYAAAKLYIETLGEIYAEHFGLSVAGLRPSLVFGAHRKRGAALWSEEIIHRPAFGEPGRVEGVGRSTKFSYVYVDDVAEQFAILCEAPETVLSDRRFFNTGGEEVSVGEMVDEVQRQIPDAQISVAEQGPLEVAGAVTRLSDDAFSHTFDYSRRYDLQGGIAAHIAAVRGDA